MTHRYHQQLDNCEWAYPVHFYRSRLHSTEGLTVQSTSSTVGPPAPPAGAAPDISGIPPPPPPAAWYTFIMIGLTTPSSSFCFASNSSFSANWFLSSQSRLSCTAFSIFSLSPSSNLSFNFSSLSVFRIVKQ